MLRPERVRIVAAMSDATGMPTTVKHRIGVDEVDQYEDMLRFVEIVSEAPCVRFLCMLESVVEWSESKENRTIPRFVIQRFID